MNEKLKQKNTKVFKTMFVYIPLWGSCSQKYKQTNISLPYKS